MMPSESREDNDMETSILAASADAGVTSAAGLGAVNEKLEVVGVAPPKPPNPPKPENLVAGAVGA